MLVLARKRNQNIVIGPDIVVKVLRVSRDGVRLGIEAPLAVPVHRQEIYLAIQQANQGALGRRGARGLPKLISAAPDAGTGPAPVVESQKPKTGKTEH
ncbi:MAG TPA: carbon storage regulator CsrA [Bacillota bacterium]|nr:carbon storage regulator CsrA [Bacillota bacterium]